MDMSNDKESYERCQRSKNDEERVTDDIEVFKQEIFDLNEKRGKYLERKC